MTTTRKTLAKSATPSHWRFVNGMLDELEREQKVARLFEAPCICSRVIWRLDVAVVLPVALVLTLGACGSSVGGPADSGAGLMMHAQSGGADGQTSGGAGSGGGVVELTGGTLRSGGNAASGGVAAGVADTGGAFDTGGAAADGSMGMVCDGFPSDCVAVCQAGSCDCQCPVAAGCPAQAPAVGEPCNADELCTYGDDPACSHIFECSRGAWIEVGESCSDTSPGSCPATLQEAQATACIERTCVYEALLCRCQYAACSGAALDPVTFCLAPTPAACLLSPMEGQSCSPEGQRCGPECCGTQFTCTDGKWLGVFIGCPP